MKGRTLAIVAGLAGVLCVAAYVVSTRGGGEAVNGAGGAAERRALLPSLKARAEVISSLSIRKGGTELMIERRGDAWAVASKDGYPAKAEVVREALRAFIEAKVVEAKTSRPELYPKLGVEDPEGAGATSALVTLRDAAGATLASVVVGKRSWEDAGDGAGAARTFVRLAGEGGALLVDGEFRVESDAMSWLDRNVGEVRNDRVREVTVEHPAGEGVEAERVRLSRGSAEDKDYVLEGMAEGRKKKDDYVFTRLAWAMANIPFDDVARVREARAKDEGAAVTTFRCFDGLTVEARTVKRDGKHWSTFAARVEAPPTGADGSAPAFEPTEALVKEVESLNAKWAGWEYQIPEWKATVLLSRMEDLLLPVEAGTPPAPEAPAGPSPSIVPDGE